MVSGHLEDPIDVHRIRIRVSVGKHRVLPFRSECIASIPFSVRYADVRFLAAPFGPRIRFNRPGFPSSTLFRYFTCRCSTAYGQIPSSFNSVIALAKGKCYSSMVPYQVGGFAGSGKSLSVLAAQVPVCGQRGCWVPGVCLCMVPQ